MKKALCDVHSGFMQCVKLRLIFNAFGDDPHAQLPAQPRNCLDYGDGARVLW